MKLNLSIIFLVWLGLFALPVQAEETAESQARSKIAFQRLDDIINRNPFPEFNGLLEQFYREHDYEKRMHIVDNILYRWASAENIAPESRKPTSLKENPMDARQLAAVEYAVGRKYHNKHWEHDEPQNPRPEAARYLKRAYSDLRNSAYLRLLSQEYEFRTLAEIIVFKYDPTEEKWKTNISEAVKYLEHQYAKRDFTSGQILLQDFENLILNYFGAKILLEAFPQYAQNNPGGPLKNYFANIGKNKPMITLEDDTVEGTAKDDFINAYAGNDTVYGRDGNDFIVGGSGDDRLFGGAGNNVYSFEVDWGKDIVNDCYEPEAGVKKSVILFEEGVSPQDISVFRSNNDYILQNTATGDEININSFFGRDKSCRISEVRFADKTVWTADELENKYSYVRYLWQKFTGGVKYCWDTIGNFFGNIIYNTINMIMG